MKHCPLQIQFSSYYVFLVEEAVLSIGGDSTGADMLLPRGKMCLSNSIPDLPANVMDPSVAADDFNIYVCGGEDASSTRKLIGAMLKSSWS